MLGWSINLFRIRGIQVALHVSFLLLLGWAGYEGYRDGGVSGMAWSAATMLAFFTCVVLHELGHSFTGMRFGVRVRRILLMPIGGMAQFDSIPRQPRQELLMTIAGPAVNFAIAGLLWLVVDFPDQGDLLGAPASLADLGRYLLAANLVMGLFNLLPVFPMDGGRILRALLATRLPYLRATAVAATIGKVLAIIAAVIALYAGNYLLAVLFAFIFVAGDSEYRAIRNQEAAQAHWEEMMRHLARAPRPPEPPFLEQPPLLPPKAPGGELGP
jgi:Zn-dependent protease